VTGQAARVIPFGDRALLVQTEDVAAAHALVAIVDQWWDQRPPVPIENVVVGFACVLVVLGAVPGPDDLDRCAEWLGREVNDVRPAGHEVGAGVTHILPVTFDGADLEEVAAMVGLTPDGVVDRVVAAQLNVAFVGFAPGFPYLTGLPPELAALPRRATPGHRSRPGR
jgi:allophanate hydrolase subunit 1